MRINLIKLWVLATIFLGVNAIYAASFNAPVTKDTEEKFLPNELMIEHCIDKETISKINKINLLFNQFSKKSLSNFKENLLTLINKNRLTDKEMNVLSSLSKKKDLCAANANLALSLYDTALLAESNIKTNGEPPQSRPQYMDKALRIYRSYANQGSIGSVKLLCVPNHWVVEAVDQHSKKICQKALYLNKTSLSANEKAMMFTAVYNAYWLPLKKHLSNRAEMCFDFANDANIMNHSNNMLKQRNKDNCNVEFIQYGNVLFSNKNYQEAFKYLSIFDQSLNKTGMPQFELGYMYQTGQGIPQNYSLAKEWYMKACATGNSPEAQYNLGMMYKNGYGVLQDYTIAHALYNMASANGLNDSAKIRDTLAKKMTAMQIEKAQTLASNWLKNWPNKLGN